MILFLNTILIILITGITVGCSPTTKRAVLNREQIDAEAETQKEIAIKDEMELDQRLQRVAYPILHDNIDSCGENIIRRLGFRFGSIESFSSEYRLAASKELGAGEDVQIIYVTPGTVADKEGLKQGDEILAINGSSIPNEGNSTKKTHKILVKLLASNEPIRLTIGRSSGKEDISLIPEEVCNYPVILYAYNSVVNAYADGKQIIITKGMMRFAQEDRELALVIAHELAHNAMGHIKSKMGNRLIGALQDGLAAGYGVNTGGAFANATDQMYSREIEAEADYVGTYMLAKAGYQIDDAAYFWRKVATENPSNIKGSYAALHPSTPERFAGIENTVMEIKKKQESGEILVPEYK